ncbi:hypothetical protein GCM10011583_32980 [Streptomyces camponoticapitis]|uniref:N-acetyltransferase domain-containing protein n=2 Tax=Streptomyces camponoticapitis TaxID=1616125 RepID=A0ABQ2E9S2_9ACTN|nr:hypothetical protein GCM10011583_32980 [Streptomyces camponoticapitis]
MMPVPASDGQQETGTVPPAPHVEVRRRVGDHLAQQGPFEGVMPRPAARAFEDHVGAVLLPPLPEIGDGQCGRAPDLTVHGERRRTYGGRAVGWRLESAHRISPFERRTCGDCDGVMPPDVPWNHICEVFRLFALLLLAQEPLSHRECADDGHFRSGFGRLEDMVRLQVLTTNDWALWREARLAALTEAPHAFKSRVGDWHRGGEERWRARLETPGAYNVLASLDGRTVGMASGLPGGDDVYELRSVWVGPGARGLGVSDQLIEAVGTWARRSGARALRLAVIPGNSAAVSLYLRNGFVLTEERGDVLSDGVTREQVMVKTFR